MNFHSTGRWVVFCLFGVGFCGAVTHTMDSHCCRSRFKMNLLDFHQLPSADFFDRDENGRITNRHRRCRVGRLCRTTRVPWFQSRSHGRRKSELPNCLASWPGFRAYIRRPCRHSAAARTIDRRSGRLHDVRGLESLYPVTAIRRLARSPSPRPAQNSKSHLQSQRKHLARAEGQGR
jgi:hypothetical protein